MAAADDEGGSARWCLGNLHGHSPWGLAGHEEVGERVGAGIGIEPGDTRDLRDSTLEAASGDEDDDVDGLGDEPARDRDHRLLDETLDPVERGDRTIGVDGGDAAGMARVPGLEHVERFGTADLADDDTIGAQAQRRADKIGHRDDAWSRPERYRVGGGTLQLACVLDQDDALVDPRHFGEERVGECGLPRAGAAGDQDVIALCDTGLQPVGRVRAP